MDDALRRRALRPWYIGLAIVVAADLWIVYRMFAQSCPAPGVVEAIVVVAIPAVYLALMYLTFTSQAAAEHPDSGPKGP